MTDLLSQEEIDALLRSGSDALDSGGDEAPPPPTYDSGSFSGKDSNAQEIDPRQHLSQEQLDGLSEVAKVALGATSSVVQMLLNQPVEIELNQLRIVSYGTIRSEAGGEEFIVAKIAYVAGFDGNSYLMLKKQVAAIIGDLMMGGPGVDPAFEEMHKSAVGEMMNQMMGKTTTTLSEVFKKRVDIAPPQVEVVSFFDAPPQCLILPKMQSF